VQRIYDNEYLVKRYLVDKVSTHKISAELGLCNSTIRNKLKKLGIVLRGWSQAQLLIEHENPIVKMGYTNWYRVTQSEDARKKRSRSHTGKVFSEERKQNIGRGVGSGSNNKGWLGDKAKYSAKHATVNKYWTKTGICQNCGKVCRSSRSNKVGTEWANLDHKYNRDDRMSWMEMCHRCNLLYDKGKIGLGGGK